MMGSHLLAEVNTRTSFELARLQSYGERWHYLSLGRGLRAAGGAGGVDGPAVTRASCVPRSGGCWPPSARRPCWACWPTIYSPSWRTERKAVHNSRVWCSWTPV